tara:strand:+ start:513 stop:1019 length:507 start_codon:yes stop_codon:yes gene_type:complete
MPRKNSLNLPKERVVETKCGIFKRLFAFIIDLLILDLIVFSPLKGVLFNLLPGDIGFIGNKVFFESNPDIFNKLAFILFYMGIIAFIYFTVLEYKFSQTIGKMLLRINIKSIVKDKLSIWRIMLSNITLFPFFPFIILWVVDPLYILFKGQRLMEKLSNIELVEKVKV